MSRWDDEFDTHRAEQVRIDRIKRGRKLPANLNRSRIEDYDPEQHLHWPEAKAVLADDRDDGEA